jgi:uncharacterized protein YbgA (DUF1722 family)
VERHAAELLSRVDHVIFFDPAENAAAAEPALQKGVAKWLDELVWREFYSAILEQHPNVLQHAAGHLKKPLDAASRGGLAERIHDHRTGLVPLIVPIIFIGHQVRRHHAAHLVGQILLDPHPKELMLRNHV